MLSNIRLQNFRSYGDASFEFEPGVNIVVGPNASGKTNLLEAISYLFVGKSFRAKDAEVTMAGKDWARLDGFAEGNDRTLKFVISDEGLVKKELTVGGRVFRRSPSRTLLPIVVFEPNHLRLFHGPPEARRLFFDDLVSQKDATYTGLLREYKKTLAQRNSLLKSGRKDLEQLFVWNVRISEQGGKIAEQRQAILAKINEAVSDTYSQIADKKSVVGLVYSTSCSASSYSSSMMKKLEQNVISDYERGFTSVGPHRDDVEVAINGMDAANVASRGEARTMLLALKIFELDNIEVWSGKEPVLLLDDVFSELDGTRRRSLTEYLNRYQSFITTTDADILSHKLVDSLNTILF